MTGWRCAAAVLAVGPLVGVAWWLLAPGGRTTSAGRVSVLETAAAQDAWFAALAALAGFGVALVWVATRASDADRRSVGCLAWALAGSLAAAALAWGTGRTLDLVADLVTGTADPARPQRLLLTSVAALIVWPLVTAVVVGVDALRDLVFSPLRGRRHRHADGATAPHEWLAGPAGAPRVLVRRARRQDVPAVVALLADDPLGSGREDPGHLAPYLAAFDAVDTSPSQLLVVAEADGAVVGTMQLSVLPGLSRRGLTRLQVEAVRVASGHRGAGLGERLLAWAVDEGRRQGCGVVQLTSDRSRVDAHRFYERLGFEASHVGFKRRIDSP